MNEHTLHDPQLQSLEARLAAMLLQVSPGEQQQLLYQCAFAAGKGVSTRSVRRWQAGAAVLIVLLLGMSVPLARDEWLLATQRVKPPVPTQESPAPKESTPSAALAKDDVPQRVPASKTVELDAWQLPAAKEHSFAEEMALLENSDPHLRSLTVGSLTRTVLNH
ncbi:MAG: hypothetical protein IAF94_14900 [Pirellulaceae bacterium]|nr:hypothetical protein [Pirellulaceae bacterium]